MLPTILIYFGISFWQCFEKNFQGRFFTYEKSDLLTPKLGCLMVKSNND